MGRTKHRRAVFAGRFHQAAEYAADLDEPEILKGPPFNTTITKLSQGVVTIVARRLRTGVTFFNNHTATTVDERAPFGGFNQSGIGRELGREGLASFIETHVMAVPEP